MLVAEFIFRREPGKQFDKCDNTSIGLATAMRTAPIMTLLRRGLQLQSTLGFMRMSRRGVHRADGGCSVEVGEEAFRIPTVLPDLHLTCRAAGRKNIVLESSLAERIADRQDAWHLVDDDREVRGTGNPKTLSP